MVHLCINVKMHDYTYTKLDLWPMVTRKSCNREEGVIRLKIL